MKYRSGNGHAGPDHKRQKVPNVRDFPEGSGMRRSFSRAPGSLDLSVFQIPEALSPLRPSGIRELDDVVNSNELQLAGMAMRSTVIQRQPSKPQPRQRIDHSESVVKSLVGSSKTMNITTVKPLKSLNQHKLMKEVPRNVARPQSERDKFSGGTEVSSYPKSMELLSVHTTKPHYKMESGKELKYLESRKVTPPKSDCVALVRHQDELQVMEPTSSMATLQPLKLTKVMGKWIAKRKSYDVAQKHSLQITPRRISAARDSPYRCGQHAPFVGDLERKKVQGRFQTRAASKNRLPHTNTQSQLITTQSEIEVGIAERKIELPKLEDPRHLSKSIVQYKEGFRLHNKNTTREKVSQMLCLFQETCRNMSREEESSSREGKHARLDHPKEIKDRKGKQVACRKSFQDEESITKPLGKQNRIHMKAFEHLKSKGMWLAAGKYYLGSVPGTEVGDEFQYRVELCLTGLHRRPWSGIDYIKRGKITVATSIVSSGGYDNMITSDGVLEYSGSGGHPHFQSEKGKGNHGDHQTLERGNLALKNSIETQTPVRVIYGLKERKHIDHQDMKNKPTLKYIYDGLYLVEKCWMIEGSQGFSVFRFQLRKISGQPMIIHQGRWV